MDKRPNRAEMIQKMHDKGMSYDDIGQVFGISRQAVWQAAHPGPGDNFHANAVMKVPYIGLRNWMLENRVTFTALSEMCGKNSIHGSLIGKGDPRKSTIDMILKVTGLTYEECFREETDDVK